MGCGQGRPARVDRGLIVIKMWSDGGWEDHLYWQDRDRRTLRRISRLIRSVERGGVMSGEGKPEPLEGDLQGCFSRRVDAKRRLVSRVSGEGLAAVS